MMGVAQTDDSTGGVGQAFQAQHEAAVHWTSCKGCQAYSVRGTLFACMVCPGFDLCENCNHNRIATQTHQHRFDFFYCPRSCNSAPSSQGHYIPINYQSQNDYQGGSAEQQLAQNQAAYSEAEQKEMLHQTLVNQEQQQGLYDNNVAAQQYGAMYGDRKRDRVAALIGLR
ncbi:hypothetical protein PRZ48_012435 [Zasmidium cellare]|uniref:ZZ-type domain-containing protein n=1 Tax=Zasmidium cellare TaxID=395010 RepID=A0ABR0E512_ZASCE|nr:hypothetical protein PRZ48_012435 [Zasmidium cellare]